MNPFPTAVSRTSDETRWAFVGASHIADAYMVDAVKRATGSTLVGVFSRDVHRGQDFASRHDIRHVYESLDELCSDEDVDAVYVSSINSHHAGDAISAAQSGKHVLCDKPLATTVEEAAAIGTACRSAGVELGVNHHLRAGPAQRAARASVASGALGQILGVRLLTGALLPRGSWSWRTTDRAAGGGAALDITVHGADLLRFLLQDEVIEVSAIAMQQDPRTQGVEDVIAGAWRLAGGAIATFQDSFNQPYEQTEVEIFGVEGTLRITDAMADDPIATAIITDKDGTRTLPTGNSDGLYLDTVEQFTSVILGHRGTPLATGHDGLVAVQIALAAREAAEAGKTVHIPR